MYGMIRGTRGSHLRTTRLVLYHTKRSQQQLSINLSINHKVSPVNPITHRHRQIHKRTMLQLQSKAPRSFLRRRGRRGTSPKGHIKDMGSIPLLLLDHKILNLKGHNKAMINILLRHPGPHPLAPTTRKRLTLPHPHLGRLRLALIILKSLTLHLLQQGVTLSQPLLIQHHGACTRIKLHRGIVLTTRTSGVRPQISARQ